jgi:hypothetical protein
VESLDITLRLHYLGDFESEKESKILLIEEQKISREFRTNFMATKRGLYMFEFDNSYSWINAKTISYQNIILSPLQIHT